MSATAADELVSAHLGRVEALAAALVRRRRLPAHVPVEDLVQAGAVGLCLAARTYDPARGTCFWTLAQRRALGEMLDWLRDNSLIRPPARGRPDAFRRTVGLDSARGYADPASPDPADPPLGAWAECEGMLARVALSPRQLEALRLRFGEGLVYDQIGRRLGVSATGAIWIVGQALAEARERLSP